MNAMTHGLRARDLLTPDENPADYQAFRKEGLRDLAPKGFLEREIASSIIDGFYRLRRCRRIEAGLLGGGRHVMDGIAARVSDDSRSDGLTPAQTIAHLMIETSKGYRARLIENLNKVTDWDLRRAQLDRMGPKAKKTPDEAILADPDLEAIKLFGELYEDELQRDPATYDVAVAFQKDMSQQEALLKLARYETQLRRSIHCALDELHRLQARRGKTPSSPFDVIDVEETDDGKQSCA
ncbi:MAG: hypothetical protein WCH04_21025 [Gammaproteobacteria bacterium]